MSRIWTKEQFQNAINVLYNGATMKDLDIDDEIYNEIYDSLCDALDDLFKPKAYTRDDLYVLVDKYEKVYVYDRLKKSLCIVIGIEYDSGEDFLIAYDSSGSNEAITLPYEDNRYYPYSEE